MIFYLAALQSMSPHLAEAAAIEGASRWYFFRRVTFPLLMPTTLFVLVNAVINAFRLVDHVVVMTRGGPDNATELLLYYIYEIGFRFLGFGVRGDADDRAAGVARARSRSRSSGSSSAGCITNEPEASSARTAERRHVARAWPRSKPPARGCSASLWVLPLAYAFWTAFHPAEFSTHFVPTAPLTLDNFVKAWHAAPFARYFLNTIAAVTMVLAAQLVLCTLAAYAFARFEFPGRNVLFALVLVQLMIMPDVLIVENYRTMNALGLQDTIVAIGLPYMASAFGIFLLRQTFKTVPRELDEAARVEGCKPLQMLWKVYVPLARPVYLAYALVSVSYHWNNFLWPLIITNSVESRPLTVGLQVFSSTDQGIDWSIITAATLLTTAPLLVALPAVPAAVRAVVHARRNKMTVAPSAGAAASPRDGASPNRAKPMKIITWNVQWCRGVDGRVDPARIVEHAKALADFDVLCLQEIASNFPDPRLAGSRGENQFARNRTAAARIHAGTRRDRRRSGRRRAAAPLRQPDPVALPGGPGVSSPAAASGRSRPSRHAADRARSDRARAVWRCTHHHHASRVLRNGQADRAGRDLARDLRGRQRTRPAGQGRRDRRRAFPRLPPARRNRHYR